MFLVVRTSRSLALTLWKEGQVELWVKTRNVLGGIAAENRLLKAVALLHLGILNFGIIPVCQGYGAASQRIDIEGLISERFTGFRNVPLTEPVRLQNALSFSASRARDVL